MITLTAIHKSFGGIAAVKDVSFSLAAGQITALIGPNGAGKSTLFNMLNGQLKPDSGSISFAGQSLLGTSPAAMAQMGIARTFQIARVFTSMTVAENVASAQIAATGHMWRRKRPDVEAVKPLLARLGLADIAHNAAADLAYGQVKRLELAMALAADPKLLLMDEPMAGMEAAERQQMMLLLKENVRQTGLTVLFTEHDMQAVFAHADRVLVLAEGAVVADGSPDDVAADRMVRALYLGEQGV